MCGICGFYNDGDEHLLAGMCNTLATDKSEVRGYAIRWPAGIGETCRDTVAGGADRELLTNEDGTVAAAFCGVIYNAGDLRAELKAKGHDFRTRADAEVVVHLYEELGCEFLNKLNGVFALAVNDGRTLFLARDRLGVKPLYYTWVNNRFYFASTVQALLMCPGVDRAVDSGAVDDYMTFQYIPAPKTLFEGIYKLSPGIWLKINQNGAWVNRYWELPTVTRRRRISPDVVITRTAAFLEEAVRRRAADREPVGVLLSGGLDSSAVAALLRRNHSGPMKTFHVKFAGENGEEVFALEVAAALGVEHYELEAGPRELSALPRVISTLAEPLADAAAWATYLLCRFAKEHVIILLTGDGGDEVFGGYPRYLLSRMADGCQRVPAVLRNLAAGVLDKVENSRVLSGRSRYLSKVLNSPTTPWERNVAWLSVFTEDERSALYTADFKREVGDGRGAALYERYYRQGVGHSVMRRLTTADVKTWLADDLLSKIHCASTAAGVEVRLPLLDHFLVDYVASLGDRYRFGWGVSKALLKKAVRHLLPASVLRRRKRAFVVPVEKWLRDHEREWICDTVTSPRALGRGYFRPEAVRALLKEFLDKGVGGAKIWNLFCLELWQQEFVDNYLPAHFRLDEKRCGILS